MFLDEAIIHFFCILSLFDDSQGEFQVGPRAPWCAPAQPLKKPNWIQWVQVGHSSRKIPRQESEGQKNGDTPSKSPLDNVRTDVTDRLPSGSSGIRSETPPRGCLGVHVASER